jgi:5,10-methylenetetrahydrofolate reductase
MKALRHWSVRHAGVLKSVYDACAHMAPRLRPLLHAFGGERAEHLIRPVEKFSKELLFDCRMCGQCVLSTTGMACPTNCAKSMRNGPCGGVRTDGGCEVDPAMRCVWIEASEGQRRAGRGTASRDMHLPIDHRLQGRSTWTRVIDGNPPPAIVSHSDSAPVSFDASQVFVKACASGRFVVTVEVAPPDSPDPEALLRRARVFDGLVDAINITDGAGGNCHMSSAAAAALLAAHGFTPVCQIACRDRNRIAVQGDILGAAALGVHNFLCLTGDDVSQGDHPEAKPVFDLDAVSLLRIARDMRDKAVFASGRKLDLAPDLFLGATANPFVPPFLDRIANLELKIDAGAQFIQTQFCFDIAAMETFMREIRARELHKRAAIIVGVGTLASARALRWMAEHVPGVHVPDVVTRRMAAAADQKAEGLRMLTETMLALRAIEGVAGVHLMGHRNEETLAEAIRTSGLREAA